MQLEPNEETALKGLNGVAKRFAIDTPPSLQLHKINCLTRSEYQKLAFRLLKTGILLGETVLHGYKRQGNGNDLPLPSIHNTQLLRCAIC